MRVIDPGHIYEFDHLDGKLKQRLIFVKRIGENYPGNEPPSHEGVIIQEVLRGLIDRVQHLNQQKPSAWNGVVIQSFRLAFNALEARAAEQHDRDYTWRHSPECEPIGPDGHHKPDKAVKRG